MKINDNGIVRDMTPEEVEKMKKLQAQLPPAPTEPSPSEQIAELQQRDLDIEAALIELAGMQEV